MLATPTSNLVIYASAPFGVEATANQDAPLHPVRASIVPYASAPFGVNALIEIDYVAFDIDPITGEIIVRVQPLFGVDLTLIPSIIVGEQRGGWLKEEEYRNSKRRQKINAKRERRQEYVMRKVYNELKGITEPDEYLLALMAEFETIEDVFVSEEEQLALLNRAYYDYIILQQIKQGEQDKEDETAIMFALSQIL